MRASRTSLYPTSVRSLLVFVGALMLAGSFFYSGRAGERTFGSNQREFLGRNGVELLELEINSSRTWIAALPWRWPTRCAVANARPEIYSAKPAPAILR